MSEKKVRYKGKWRSKKMVEKQIKTCMALQQSRQDDGLEGTSNQFTPEVQPTSKKYIEGRVVHLSELGNNLFCKICKMILSLADIEREVRHGLHSILHIRCRSCNVLSTVTTGKTHSNRMNKATPDINSKIILGCIHAGIVGTTLNKVLTCVGVPAIPSTLF